MTCPTFGVDINPQVSQATLMDNYYIISTSEDGDVSLTIMSQAKLEKALADKDWGDRPLLKTGDRGVADLTAESGLIIIKGTNIVPRPKTVVETWEVS